MKLRPDLFASLPLPFALVFGKIGRIHIRTTAPLFFDSYRKNRISGSVILIDEGTHETVGAGMIV